MPSAAEVLLVDDEPHVLASTAQTLEIAGFNVTAFQSATDALREVDRGWPGIVISDLRMPRLDGIELMQKIQQRDPDIPFILISGHADIADAVKAIQRGAYDFLEKPFHQGRLRECAKRAQDHRNLVLENRRLSTALNEHAKDTWIGNSIPAQSLRDELTIAAQTCQPFTLLGERGCGKNLAAFALHKMAMRSGKFGVIDCRAINKKTDWAEIVASTGEGTLVLQHLDRANPMGLQSLSLKLSGDNPWPFQLIATSRTVLSLNTELDLSIPSSLFYKLTRKIVTVPNLQSRAEDIPLLFRHFLDLESRRLGRPAPVFGSLYLADLMTRNWTDNTRELKNTCDSWFARNEAEKEIKPETWEMNSEAPISLPERVLRFEKQLILRELETQRGEIKKTYEALGIPRKTLYDKLSKYGISREQFLSDDD